MTRPPYSRFLIIFVVSAILLVAGCGKKGAPSLKSYERPPAPSELRAFGREGRIYLRWSFPKDKEFTLSRLVVLRSSGNDFVKIAEAPGSERSFTDASVSIGIRYRYKVLAQNQRGVFSADSNLATIETAAVPPPPHGVSFRVTGSSVELAWQETANGQLYNVYRMTAPGEFGLDPVNTEPLRLPFFADTFDRTRSVRYIVRSLTDKSTGNEGPASEEIIVDPASLVPVAVHGLRVFSSENRMYLSWDEPSETWVTGYRVYRRAGGGDYRLIGQPQTPAFVDAEASQDRYDYRVHAVGPRLEGPGVEITGIRLTGTP